MGKSLKTLIEEDQLLNLKAGFDQKGKDSKLKNLSPKSVDIVIDFSSPRLFSQMLSWSSENQLPFLSGTTGISSYDENQMKKHSQNIPLFWASNMSLGVALLQESLNVFSGWGKKFDFQIEEFHHKQKKDKPSGTALTLQEKLKTVTDQDQPEALSVRGGDVFGIHKVWAFSKGEVLCFKHTALSRDIFASGALDVAKWLVKKEAGFYSMKDYLKFQKNTPLGVNHEKLL